MGLIIGQAFAPHTWAGLRSAIFDGTIVTTGTHGDHSMEYDQGFKTTAGNGFVRTDYTALYANAAAPLSGPNFTASGLIPSPPSSEFASLYTINGGGSSSGMLVNEDRLQFAGQTAVLTSGSITITSAAFVDPVYQTYTTYNASESITSIGLLTAF
jgi:hypothetical protein